jgi:hypothetical protein
VAVCRPLDAGQDAAPHTGARAGLLDRGGRLGGAGARTLGGRWCEAGARRPGRCRTAGRARGSRRRCLRQHRPAPARETRVPTPHPPTRRVRPAGHVRPGGGVGHRERRQRAGGGLDVFLGRREGRLPPGLLQRLPRIRLQGRVGGCASFPPLGARPPRPFGAGRREPRARAGRPGPSRPSGRARAGTPPCAPSFPPTILLRPCPPVISPRRRSAQGLLCLVLPRQLRGGGAGRGPQPRGPRLRAGRRVGRHGADARGAAIARRPGPPRPSNPL